MPTDSQVQLGMVVLDVRDLRRSVEFYRLLGLAVPDPFPDRPVALLRMDSGVSLVLVEEFSATNDPGSVRPEPGHYQQMLEFVVDDDAAVDAVWNTLTAAGHHGRQAPHKINAEVYAALVDDPDGNVLLISSDPTARPTAAVA